MSWNPTHKPDCPDSMLDAVETLIVPRSRDLGGFEDEFIPITGKLEKTLPR